MIMVKYYFALLYLCVNFTATSQITPPSELQTYYADVDFNLTSTALYDALATETIAKHTNILRYSERHQYLYDVDQDINNPHNVILIYNGVSRPKKEYQSSKNPNDLQTFNTEHVYPQSLIVNTAKGDLHHLRVCYIKLNTSRSNKPFVDGTGTYHNFKKGWYPGDEWKGDVARMIMYLNLRYHESFNDIGNLSLFLKWNAEDPVSDFEKHRNEMIYTIQGNRNPFIDNPYIATLLWGGPIAENRWK